MRKTGIKYKDDMAKNIPELLSLICDKYIDTGSSPEVFSSNIPSSIRFQYSA